MATHPRYHGPVDPAQRHYVFGYGSLLDRGDGGSELAGGPYMCDLSGYRRTWNVAMDNTRSIPGYKYYVDRATGERAPWYVAFLNIVPDSDATVNGVVFEASHSLLTRLDQRERNYTRIDVSAGLSDTVDGTVWAYVGSDAAIERFRIGYRTGRAVISRDYYEGVCGNFAELGAGALQRFVELTDGAPCPMRELRRVDYPAGVPLPGHA
jgi:hypothetical protein